MEFNKNFMESFAEKLKKDDERKKRYIEKMESLDKDIRNEFIKKVRSKYGSDEYRDREYKCGREPRELLYDVIFDWMEATGESHTPDTEFCAAKYTKDGWVIRLFIGQGSFIALDPETEDRYADTI